MSSQGPDQIHSISKALTLLQTHKDDSDLRPPLDEALDTLVAASRSGSTRPHVSGEQDFVAALNLLKHLQSQVSSQAQGLQKLLRYLGNALNGRALNGKILEADEAALLALGGFIVAENTESGQQDLSLANIAVSVVYNLYIVAPSAASKCYDLGLDLKIARYVQSCAFVEDAVGLESAIELLGDIAGHGEKTSMKRDYDHETVALLLGLPIHEHLEEDYIEILVEAVNEYLKDESFQVSVIRLELVGLLLDILERLLFLPPTPSAGSVSLNPEDAISDRLTDMSLLAQWPSSFSTSKVLVQRLLDMCVLTKRDADSSRIAANIVASTLLANYCSNAEACITIAQRLRLMDLYDAITLTAYHQDKDSKDVEEKATGYLYVVTGLLGRLASNSENRIALFRDHAIKSTAMTIVQYPNAQVQTCGLILLRNLTFDDPTSINHIVSSGFHTILLRMFLDPLAEPPIKLQIARALMAIVRSASQSTSSAAREEAIEGFLSTPQILDPMVYSLAQLPTPALHAEAYMSLCVIARIAPERGHGLVAIALENHAKILPTLENDIRERQPVPGKPAEADDDALPIQGGPSDVAAIDKQRAGDNAIFLLSGLLKWESLDHGLRDKLDAIAAHTGVALVLY